MQRYIYPNHEEIIKIHDNIILISGWLNWYYPEKIWYISACCDFIQNDDYYMEFADKLSYLMYSISMGHCFCDGNKRTALIIASYFIHINYNKFLADKFISEFENIVVQVADNIISKNSLTQCISDFMQNFELQESSLLLIYHDLQEHWLMDK